MLSRILHSYPARFVFLLAAIAIAICLISFRILLKRGIDQLSPNHSTDPESDKLSYE